MLEKSFPKLRTTLYGLTSPPDRKYNCIAWAVGDKSRNWWPHRLGYWPAQVTRKATIEAFIEVLGLFGYVPCDSPSHQPDKEKIAIYAVGDSLKHAARQLRSGMWSSKLGPNVDIAHELEGLVGTEYGKVVAVLERPRT